MSRPAHTTVTSGQLAWDGDVDGNFTLIFTDPFPISAFANDGALPTNSTNDNCLAVTVDTSQLWISETVNDEWLAPTRIPIMVALSDETTVITTSPTEKFQFRMPYKFLVESVRASLITPASAGTFTVDINEGGATILTTKLTFDAGESTTEDATTPAVIGGAGPVLADDAVISFDVDDAGSAADAVGLKVTLIGRQMS